MKTKKYYRMVRDKLKIYLTAICFCFGLLIAGAESIWWPWHLPVGLAVFAFSVFMARKSQNDKEQQNRSNNS